MGECVTKQGGGRYLRASFPATGWHLGKDLDDAANGLDPPLGCEMKAALMDMWAPR